MHRVIDYSYLLTLNDFGYKLPTTTTWWEIITLLQSIGMYIGTSVMLFSDEPPSFMVSVAVNNNVIFQEKPFSNPEVAYRAAIVYCINNLQEIVTSIKQYENDKNKRN